jgi:hypothetical protein
MKQIVASKNLPMLEIDSERIDYRRANGDLDTVLQVQRFLPVCQSPGM